MTVMRKNPVQIYRGETFYWRRDGYFRRLPKKGGHLLHRVVWEAERGPIPPGHHIHHVDGDRANNRIENLELLTHAEHSRLHFIRRIEEGKVDHSPERMAEIRKVGRLWHSSPEGKAWHSQQSKNNWAKWKASGQRA